MAAQEEMMEFKIFVEGYKQMCDEADTCYNCLLYQRRVGILGYGLMTKLRVIDGMSCQDLVFHKPHIAHKAVEDYMAAKKGNPSDPHGPAPLDKGSQEQREQPEMKEFFDSQLLRRKEGDSHDE